MPQDVRSQASGSESRESTTWVVEPSQLDMARDAVGIAQEVWGPSR